MMQSAIIQTSIYITLVPLVFGLLRFSKLSLNQKILFWMILIISFNQLTSEFLESHVLNISNNLPFYRFYLLVEFVFVSILFKRLIQPKSGNVLLWIIVSIFSLLWISDSFVFGSLWTYPDIIRFVESITIIIFGLIFFYKTFRNAKIVLLTNEFGFWFAAGLTLYFACNNLLFFFSEFVLTLSDHSYYLIWTVHAFLTILLYIAYTIAIQCKTNHNLS
jgi:hypothetical protein